MAAQGSRSYIWLTGTAATRQDRPQVLVQPRRSVACPPADSRPGRRARYDAWYRDWQEENGLPYPKSVRIQRPRDGYRIDIQILKAGLNEPVPDTSFVLNLPQDIQVERIGEPAAETTAQASND